MVGLLSFFYHYVVQAFNCLHVTAFRGELTSHHPHFHPASPAVAKDIDIKTAKQLLPNGLTVGIHMGTWHKPSEPYDASKVHEDIKYTEEDDKAIDDWIAGT